VSTPKRFTVTRQRARELGEGVLEEEEDPEDLVPFEEMLKDWRPPAPARASVTIR
jgi:hypothetical protein